MKKLILIFIAVMSCLVSAAQQTPGSVVFDVNGLQPGKHYTDAQIIYENWQGGYLFYFFCEQSTK